VKAVRQGKETPNKPFFKFHFDEKSSPFFLFCTAIGFGCRAEFGAESEF
jgi:hypothetical protein